MNHHQDLQLRNQNEVPTDETLAQVLGESYVAYEALQDVLPDWEIEQEWQWYKPYKAWFARGQYFWITSRGTSKEKTLYWLYIYEGYFVVAVWFKEKNRSKVLSVKISEKTKELIFNSEANSGLPTFPVLFKITDFDSKQLADISTLVNFKKKIEK